MHGISLNDLQYLVVVADERSFRRAAERCHITQPTLSGQVKKIEDILGTILFERGTRGLIITDIGQKVINEARQILHHADLIMELARSHQGLLVGSLHIGIIPTLCPYLLPYLVPHLQREYGRLNLTICEDLTVICKIREFYVINSHFTFTKFHTLILNIFG